MKRAILPVQLARILALLSLGATAAAATPETATLLQEIRSVALKPSAAVAVQDVTLPLGDATVRLERGTIVPATPVAGQVAEMVFLGSGRIEMEVADEIEAGQLELFTGRTRLAETFDDAVLVIADEETVRGLLAAGIPKPGAEARAGEVFDKWKASPERRVLNVEGALFADGLSDPVYRTYFAGWFRGASLGRFVYSIDPSEEEPVTLGQFIPLEITERDSRWIAGRIRREQREGRLVGLRVEDLGTWNTWVSPVPQEDAGPSRQPFTPERYTLDVTLSVKAPHLTGRARLDLRAGRGAPGGQRIVDLWLHGDLKVQRVTDGAGRELPFLQTGSVTSAHLTEPPVPGAAVTLAVEYSGNFFEGGRFDLYALRDTISWYPRVDPGAYVRHDVTLRWPKNLDLVASGRRTDGGEDARGLWERRTLDVPAQEFSFVLGQFRTQTLQVGHVAVTVAFDRHAARLSTERAELVTAAIQDTLAFFELAYGPYPLDYLTVVNVPRDYSQGLLGFVTLGDEVINYRQGFAGYFERTHDPRAVVAHEISHQWWGNLVGWKSYRDQWFSEALANYSALLYGRARLGWKEDDPGTVLDGWYRQLSEAILTDGRPLESVGPLVLGGRLDSSHAPDAYTPIAYKKGGVILETLSRAIAPRKLWEVLRALTDKYRGGAISTRELLDFIEAETKTDLDWFARRFVYGTGWPEIDYRYAVEPRAQGGWTVKVQAHQRSPYRFRYRLAAKPGGVVDVVRDLVPLFDVSRSAVSVPVQIAFPAPERAGRARGKEEEPPVVEGRILVRGRDSEFTLELDGKPSDIWLDRDGVVYARLYKEGQRPKEQLLQLAHEAAAAGRTDEAITRLREASTQELLGDEEGEDVARRAERWGTRFVEAWVQLELARLHLDQERTAEARAAIKAADNAVPEFYRSFNNLSSPLLFPYRRWLVEQLALVESRLDLQTGKPEKAFARLRDPLLSDNAVLDHTEAYLLLAVAARATGHTEDYAEALKVIRARGVETGPLQQERAAAK